MLVGLTVAYIVYYSWFYLPFTIGVIGFLILIAFLNIARELCKLNKYLIALMTLSIVNAIITILLLFPNYHYYISKYII